jgi:hypothetical protein
MIVVQRLLSLDRGHHSQVPKYTLTIFVDVESKGKNAQDMWPAELSKDVARARAAGFGAPEKANPEPALACSGLGVGRRDKVWDSLPDYIRSGRKMESSHTTKINVRKSRQITITAYILPSSFQKLSSIQEVINEASDKSIMTLVSTGKRGWVVLPFKGTDDDRENKSQPHNLKVRVLHAGLAERIQPQAKIARWKGLESERRT